MRILTVRQPWAWAIIHGGKDVENRVRNLAGDYRGEIAIHAGIRDDEDAYWNENIDFALDDTMTTADSLTRGAIIGVVDLVDVHHAEDGGTDVIYRDDDGMIEHAEACSVWADEFSYHLVIANPRPLAQPIPYRGALGLRRLDANVTAAILEAIA